MERCLRRPDGRPDHDRGDDEHQHGVDQLGFWIYVRDFYLLTRDMFIQKLVFLIVVIGAIVMMSLVSGMNLMGIDISTQYIVRGAVLAIAVIFDVATRNKGK